MNGEITPDCRSEGCCGCGLPGSDHIKLASSVAATVSTHSTESTELTRKWGRERERVSSRIAAPFYFRVRYGKSSEIRFISHLDITRLWTRILRMSNLPIIYSGGFFPRPEIDFGPALPVGVTSKVELMDFAIDSQFKGNVTNILLKAAYKYLPVFDVLLRVPDAPSLCSQIKRASYNVVFPEDFWSVKNIEFRSALECFKIQKEIFHTVKRENKKDKIVDLKKAIIEIKEIHDGFSMLLSVGDENGQNTNPDTVLMNIFKIEPVEMGKTMVERTGFFNNQLNSV
jgi:radical SAM-linked protein